MVDSREAVVLRVTSAFLTDLFVAHPELMGKFFCLLSIDQVSSMLIMREKAIRLASILSELRCTLKSSRDADLCR